MVAYIPGLYSSTDLCYHNALGMAYAYTSLCRYFICKGDGYRLNLVLLNIFK